MDEGGDEHDVYVAQLQEVFDSCDKQGEGRLDSEELRILCGKLQLEDQADTLVQQLIGTDPKSRVSLGSFQ